VVIKTTSQYYDINIFIK